MSEQDNVIEDKIIYNPTQEEMIKYMLYDERIRAVYSHGGVRSGKSLCICKLCMHLAYGFPGSKVLVARDTRVNLKNTTLATFFGSDFKGNPVILPELYNLRDYNKTEGMLKWPNGSVTCFWGMDSPDDVEKIKSTEWSAIMLEEAPGIDIEVIRFLIETRLSHSVGPHKMMLTSNTDSGLSDVYQLFYEDHNRGEDPRCEMCVGPCEFRTIASNTLQNEKNLPKNYVRRLKNLKKTNPRYYDIYVMGKFAEFTRRIYPEFEINLHVVDIPPGWEEPAGTIDVYGYDHGYSGAPTSLITCKLLPDGTFLFWDEYYETGKAVKTMSKDFKDAEINYIHAADPSIRNKTQYKESKEGDGELISVQGLYTQYEVTMELANNEVNGGIERVKSLLLDDKDHKHPIFEGIDHCPYILIARRDGGNSCPNLTRQFQKYRNKQDSRGNVNQSKWVPVKEDDHSLDAARYIVNSPLAADHVKERKPDFGTLDWVKYNMKRKVEKGRRTERELSTAV